MIITLLGVYIFIVGLMTLTLFLGHVPAGSPSCGWDVAVYVFDTNQLSLPTPFYSVLVSISVFKAPSTELTNPLTVFHSINSPDNPLLSHSVLPF